MEFENLLKLIEHVSKSELDSFSYEESGTKIKLKKDKKYVEAVEAPAKATKNRSQENVPEEVEVVSGNEVKSPLVGVFYAAPAEDAPAFVSVGDTVKKGQTLAIVEAMKLMNEIESDFDGVVKKIAVSNGEPVEYGQTLFVIE